MIKLTWSLRREVIFKIRSLGNMAVAIMRTLVKVKLPKIDVNAKMQSLKEDELSNVFENNLTQKSSSSFQLSINIAGAKLVKLLRDKLSTPSSIAQRTSPVRLGLAKCQEP